MQFLSPRHGLFLIAITFFIMCLSFKLSAAQVSSGELIIHEAFPSKYVASRNLRVWLPTQYSDWKKTNKMAMFPLTVVECETACFH
jgi:hypothetical protein